MIDRIQMVLQTKDLTPAKFADEIGVQRSSVSHILSGRNGPSLDFIQKVLKRYPDISAAWLVNGEGQMYPGLGALEAEKARSYKSSIPDLFSDPEQEAESVDYQKAETPKEPIKEKPVKQGDNAVGNVKEVVESATPAPTLRADIKSPSIEQIIIVYNDGTFSSLSPKA